MADISVSNIGGNRVEGLFSSQFLKTGAAFLVAFALTVGLHSFFGTEFGSIGIWVVTAVVFAGAAYFVGQSASGAGAGGKNSAHIADMEGQVNAIKRSQAVIEFNIDGTIITANDNFLNAMGYSLAEVVGEHHRMFVDRDDAASAEYRSFWEKLRRGDFVAGDFKRINKAGDDVWIQASYNAILDSDGQPFKVVKYATDITAQKNQFADFSGQIEAIGKSQATIEFNMDGTIITANENFLSTMGYTLDEVRGKHHSMFAEPDFAASDEYKQFWEKLNRGEYESAEFKRLGKGGKEVWIQASYNPIQDLNGKPFKVVKYATDITAEKVAAAANAENAKIKVALDGAQTNVMIADNDFNIIYMNESMMEMMKSAEADIKEGLPRFDAASLLGTNIDQFHKNPAYQRGLVGGMTDTFEGRISIGRRTFSLIANPVVDSTGERFGTSVEWTDLTDRLAKQEAAAKIAADNARIKTALDGAQANVMLADNDFNIIYMNVTMIAMMKNAEADIKKDLPNFSADGLMGTNIDGFHKDPSHQRSMVGKLESTYETSIVIGGRTFNLIANPVNDESGVRLGTSVEWADVTEKLAAEAKAKEIADANAQIKQALDKVTANVMVADADMHINYMNDAMVNMFAMAEADIRKELPGFDSSKLMGANPDVFHKNPAHQRGMISALKGTHSTEIGVGTRRFTLIANPVHDESGERLGTVVEWGDVTAERAVEGEINEVVAAAVAGDLTQRVELDGKDGFMRLVSEGINSLAAICDKGLNDVADMLKAMSAGDLTQRITEEYQGTFDDVKQSANATAEKLSEVLTQIMMGAGEVANASTEIASGSADLSQRTEQQASSLEETAASMEEMEGAVKTNADNAVEANKQGTTAREVAEKGGSVVENAVEAMSRIEDSSRKISDIIAVIDEIAFQTNLLALNAAVEAARAGDAGKGFAVVASEVRALAQRSSEAAKDIKTLIVASNTQVKDGVDLVNEAGEQLEEIVTSIKLVTDRLSEISSANQEQATGIAEINRAIAEMDEMTQQNSALVEETAASARALEEQADVMQDRVSFFKARETGEQTSAGGNSERAPRAAAARPSKAAKQKPAKKAAPKKAAKPVDDDDWAEF